MELREALTRATQILDEERRFPTAEYKDLTPSKHVNGIWVSGPQYVLSLRAQRPRKVCEDTGRFQFDSINYNLFCALSSQLSSQERQKFLEVIIKRVVTPPGSGRADKYQHSFHRWGDLVSELPLVAEFVIRNGGREEFWRTLGEAKPLPGHVLLLEHLEDMIALNFTIFSENEYQDLVTSMSAFHATTNQLLMEYGAKHGRSIIGPYVDGVDVLDAFHYIITSAASIQELCRKARYLYLMGSLLEGLNLEINQDKNEVESYLEKLGFTKVLIDSLNEADRLYRSGTTVFEIKSSMGHLRSFLENVHSQAVTAMSPSSPAKKWGEVLKLLSDGGVLSKAEEEFIASLYTLISDEAVHPLIAEREFARLARNMVIEYGLLFLRKLEKRGLKIA